MSEVRHAHGKAVHSHANGDRQHSHEKITLADPELGIEADNWDGSYDQLLKFLAARPAKERGGDSK